MCCFLIAHSVNLGPLSKCCALVRGMTDGLMSQVDWPDEASADAQQARLVATDVLSL